MSQKVVVPVNNISLHNQSVAAEIISWSILSSTKGHQNFSRKDQKSEGADSKGMPCAKTPYI